MAKIKKNVKKTFFYIYGLDGLVEYEDSIPANGHPS